MAKRSSKATRTERRTRIGVAILAAIVFVVDVFLPLGVASGVLHVGVVLVALRSSSERLVIGTAVACSLLTLLDMPLSPGPGSTEWWKVIVNRGLSVFVIWVTAILGRQRNLAAEAQRRHLTELAHLGRVKTAECLAGALAHELNQPLAAMALQADIARQRLADVANPEELDAALREIAGQSHRASDIVKALRNFLRRTESDRQVVDLRELIDGSLRLIQSAAKSANVELRSQSLAQPVRVRVDRVQIEQVLLNLLQNAIDALAVIPESQRQVTIASHQSLPAEVRVEVSDTGPGIASELAQKLFDPFCSSKSHGLGMGLAISRSIIEAHGGRLWLLSAEEPSLSNSPRAGTTFAFTLPLAP
ncbi:MAG: sensor histidine kinase with ATP-binding region [Planctomycetota bacterium]|nr:MAG: sensor histidine kinase with ATP-binding region [Planctomycetota bacterium]